MTYSLPRSGWSGYDGTHGYWDKREQEWHKRRQLKLFKDAHGRVIPLDKLNDAQLKEIAYDPELLEMIASKSQKTDEQLAWDKQHTIPVTSDPSKRLMFERLYNLAHPHVRDAEVERVARLPNEYEALYKSSPEYNVPQVLDEIIDELSGFKTVIIQYPDGRKITKRVVLPLTAEQEEQKNKFLQAMSSSMNTINTLLSERPELKADFEGYNRLIGSINEKDTNQLQSLFENFGIANFAEQIKNYKERYTQDFSEKMGRFRDVYAEKLAHMGYGGKEGTAWNTYQAMMDKAQAKGEGDISMAADLVGQKLLGDETNRRTQQYLLGKEARLNEKTQANQKLKLELLRDEQNATLHQQQYENAIKGYTTAENAYNNLMSRYNQSMQGLSDLSQQDTNLRNTYDVNLKNISHQKKVLEEQRLQNLRQNALAREQLELQREIAEEANSFNWGKALGSMVATGVGSFAGGYGGALGYTQGLRKYKNLQFG